MPMEEMPTRITSKRAKKEARLIRPKNETKNKQADIGENETLHMMTSTVSARQDVSGGEGRAWGEGEGCRMDVWPA